MKNKKELEYLQDVITTMVFKSTIYLESADKQNEDGKKLDAIRDQAVGLALKHVAEALAHNLNKIKGHKR